MNLYKHLPKAQRKAAKKAKKMQKKMHYKWWLVCSDSNWGHRRVPSFISLMIWSAMQNGETYENARANQRLYCNNVRLDFTTTLPINGFRLAYWLMHPQQFHRFIYLTKLSAKWNRKIFYCPFKLALLTSFIYRTNPVSKFLLRYCSLNIYTAIYCLIVTFTKILFLQNWFYVYLLRALDFHKISLSDLNS